MCQLGTSFQSCHKKCLVWRCYNTGGTATYCSASSYEAHTQTQHAAAEKWLATVSQKPLQGDKCKYTFLTQVICCTATVQQHVTTSKLIFVLQRATKKVLFIARLLTAEQVTLLLHSKLLCCLLSSAQSSRKHAHCIREIGQLWDKSDLKIMHIRTKQNTVTWC
jgi:hypothetical protein